ncbi:MAG TPA: YhjD/YihY/BrkB family envelope integrity protein [Longimicrobium sp.]|nr:YhjD/YihY/BrkB family envelope integrity protein [Longimicrobium sp.]
MEPETRFDSRGEPPVDDTPSVGELFRSLSTDASRLVRQEIALARAEMRRNVSSLAGNAGKILVGAVLASVGALVLVAALVAGLGELLGDRYWLSALLVGVVFVGAGGFLVFSGLKKAKEASLAPAETLETLRETGDWAKTEVTGLRAALAGHADGARGNGRAAPAATNRVASHTASAGVADRAAERETGRGAKRTAKRGMDGMARESGKQPLSMPLWKRVMKEFKDDDLAGQAAKVAYYFFLSLPPLVMALFGLAGLFGSDQTAAWLTGRLQSALPPEASGLIQGFVDQVVREKHPGLFSVGLLLALWAGSAVFTALEVTLNAAYEIEEERSFIRSKGVALGTLVAVGLLFTAGSAALLAGPAITNALGLGPVGETIWSIAQWPLGFALVVGAFWVIYYVLPNKDQRGCKKVLLKSAAMVAVLFLAATLAFRLYITNFSSYSASYGLLGTIIVLLLWMYVTSLVILVGGEISSEMERTA